MFSHEFGLFGDSEPNVQNNRLSLEQTVPAIGPCSSGLL